MNISFFLFLLLHGCFSVYLHSAITMQQPSVYMDEEFHVAQAQRFCNGSWEWDPKITTPPGLYLPNVVVSHGLRLLGLESASASVCSTAALRFLNVLFALMNYCVVHSILASYATDKKAGKGHSQSAPRGSGVQLLHALEAFTIVQFPNLHFYTMMYYTDPGSTLCLLLLVRLHLARGGAWLQGAAFLVGFLSLAFRQTNLVWLFCLALQRCLTILDRHFTQAWSKKSDSAPQTSEWQKVAWLLSSGVRVQAKVLSECIWLNAPHVANAVIGVTFVLLNGGVALGHRDAHELVLHIMQVAYLVLFASCYAAPLISLAGVRALLVGVGRAPLRTAAAVALVTVAVHFNSLVHPFVLADNRHYFFYVYARLLSRPVVRYGLAPVYVLAATALWNLQASDARGFRLDRRVFALCTVLSVLTHMLVEPRYFVAPYILFRVLLRPAAAGPEAARWTALLRLAIELAGYAVVQAVTVYVFLYRPFTQAGEVRRFMW